MERAAHWATAALFGVLICTALPLYFVSVASVVGRRPLIADIHTWAGVALPLPLAVSLVGPWGSGLRRDVRRVNLWTARELRWLLSLGREPLRLADKLNPGQKLNAAFTAGVIVVMLATGSVMRWVGPFPVAWRTGATFVHDVVAAALAVVVIGHICLAVTHREALRSMVRGWVSEAWASRHAAGWLEEVVAEEADGLKGAAAVPDTSTRR
ncbi:MAG: cytochrome b/b6 domain-containing protein [Acidimicrobiales bacterium]